MKFSPRLLTLLKNFNNINPGIVISPGSKLVSVANGKIMFATAEVPDTFEHRFAIADLSRFLSVLSVFTDPDIDVSDGKSAIISEGKRKVGYTLAAPAAITTTDKQFKIPSIDVEFVLEKDVLEQAKRAADILKLPKLAFVGDGSKITISALDIDNPTTDSYDFEIGETDLNFRFVINTEKFKMIPDDYEVQLSAKGVAQFKSVNEELTYVLTIETSSTFEG